MGMLQQAEKGNALFCQTLVGMRAYPSINQQRGDREEEMIDDMDRDVDRDVDREREIDDGCRIIWDDDVKRSAMRACFHLTHFHFLI